MTIQTILEDMMEIARSLGYTVRREKGTFRGGACVLNNQKIILLNKHIPAETLTVTLARILSNHDLENTVMKPSIRAAILRELDRVA